MSIEIKLVKYVPEVRQVVALADEIWHECFVDIISEGQIDYMVEKFQSLAPICNQIEKEEYEYYMVLDDGDLCGYFAICPQRGAKLFLSKLYLRKDKRGMGIANMMLDFIFDRAKRERRDYVYLTVNRGNTHAIEVYKKKGFKIVRDEVTDIGGGYVMDDHIMQKDIEHD